MTFKCNSCAGRYDKEMRAAYARWVEYGEAARAMRQAMRFFTNREILKALQRWQEYVENKKDHEEKIARAVSRFVNKALNAAVTRWMEWTEETISARQAGERAVRFLLNKQLAGAFSRWIDFAEESVEMKEKLYHAMAGFVCLLVFKHIGAYRLSYSPDLRLNPN